MQAGGLAPPPPIDPSAHGPSPNPPATKTEEELDDAKDKDSERGLTWVWLNAELGYEHVGLQTFNVDEENFTAGFIASSSNGFVVGAGVGARLVFITLGGRVRLGFFDAWQLLSVGGELGFHIPIGRFEPRFNLGGGYAAVGVFDDALLGADPAVSIRGFYVRAGGGLDFFVTPIFSVGAHASFDFMGLTRPGLSPSEIASIQGRSTEDAEKARAQVLAAEGSGYGSAFALTAVLGLHF